MNINHMHIENVGGITNLEIDFHRQMNILCGPNGIGKTTVLECIAHCFSIGSTPILKRHVGSMGGKIKGLFFDGGKEIAINMQFQSYEPHDRANIVGMNEKAATLLSLKTTRTFAYAPLNSISKDSDKSISTLHEESRSGVSIHDVKNWFVNRYLYSAHPDTLTDVQLENFELAKTCFSALNKNFSFSKVNASSNEILVKTPSGVIYYEYLSAGFKSCLAILFGILKEIEFRFSSRRAKEFDGIVLIDELELHLHPEWQSRIVNVLTTIFPCTQFIVTTHSPHIIQWAEPDQIVALESRSGQIVQRDLPTSSYGFKGWTLDEVLTDVMGMADTRTEFFGQLMDAFNEAIDVEDQAAAQSAYEKLDFSLHPMSHVRKLLRLQLASIASAQ